MKPLGVFDESSYMGGGDGRTRGRERGGEKMRSDYFLVNWY